MGNNMVYRLTNYYNNNKKYEDRKQRKVCVRCGNTRALTGKVYCEDCLEKNRLKSKKYYSQKQKRWGKNKLIKATSKLK